MRIATSVRTEVLISTPHRPESQGAVNGNPYEYARLRSTADDFGDYVSRPSSTQQSVLGILSTAPIEAT